MKQFPSIMVRMAVILSAVLRLALTNNIAAVPSEGFLAPSPAQELPSFPSEPLAPSPVSQEPPPVLSLATPQIRPKGLLTVRTLRIAGTGDEPRVYFSSASDGPKNTISIGAGADGVFLVEKYPAAKILSIDSKGGLEIHAEETKLSDLKILSSGGFSMNGVRQWQLVHGEVFNEEGDFAVGWDRTQVSQCAGVYMIGGYCKMGRGEIRKTFQNLPAHSQLRVVANFHFIDNWIGETGYLKLDANEAGDPVIVWSDQHAQTKSKNGISLCGQGSTPEGKFSVPVDVVISHRAGSAQLVFGSTMENSDPCDESWGVSGIEIYVRA